MNLRDRLEAMGHLHVKLERKEAEPHRPQLSLWASAEEGVPEITICIGALHGQQQRFVSLSINEAKSLANKLLALSLDTERLSKKIEPFMDAGDLQ